MPKQELCDALWAGTISRYELDLTHFAFRMWVDTRYGDVWSHYRVEMRGMISFGFSNAGALLVPDYLQEPWRFIELTSIAADPVKRSGQDFISVQMELWGATLEVVCKDLAIERLP